MAKNVFDAVGEKLIGGLIRAFTASTVKACSRFNDQVNSFVAETGRETQRGTVQSLVDDRRGLEAREAQDAEILALTQKHLDDVEAQTTKVLKDMGVDPNEDQPIDHIPVSQAARRLAHKRHNKIA